MKDEDHSSNYFTVLKMSWALNVSGELGIQSEYHIIFLVIFFSTILNLILMLNMIISILGDSYDQFTLDKNMIDYREKISLTLEVQTALFWKNQLNKSFFVHFITSQFENRADETDDWQGRMMFADQRQEQRIKDFAGTIDQRINEVESKINAKIEGKIDGVETKLAEISSQLRQLIERHKT
jgi:hypothetical protein